MDDNPKYQNLLEKITSLPVDQRDKMFAELREAEELARQYAMLQGLDQKGHEALEHEINQGGPKSLFAFGLKHNPEFLKQYVEVMEVFIEKFFEEIAALPSENVAK